MDWTGRLLPPGGYGSTSEYGSNNGYASTSSDLPQQQTVSLRDLDLGRWRPAESCGYDTSTSNDLDTPENCLDTPLEAFNEPSLEQYGDMSPTTYTSGVAVNSPKSDTSMSSDDTDDEPDLDSPMAYARFYGLRRDFPFDLPLSSDLIPLPPENMYLDMEEPPVLSRAEALQADVWESLKNEKLDVDRETATFLASLLRAAKRSELDPIDVVLEPESLHRLKLELPLLAKDHEVEMLALRRRNEVRLCSEGIEHFQLDPEKDESIAFPRAQIDKKLSLDRELANEKLDVGKETVELLRDLRELWSGKDGNLLDGLYESYKKSKAIHVSPPLLPVTPPYSPSAPAAEAMQIELTSTPEDLIAKDAAAAEKEILDSHQTMDITPLHGPLFNAQEIFAAIDSYTAVPSSSSPLARKRLRSLYLEPPLTPHAPVETTSSDESSSAKRAKKVHFDPGLVALLPNVQLESSDTLSGISGQQAMELQDTILREAESVQLELQNEQLVDIDTTLRVGVPELEPIQPQPPWESHGSNEADGTSSRAQQTTMRHLSKGFLKDTRKWAGVAKLERTLLWAPFPFHLAKVDLREQFDSDCSLNEFMADMVLDDNTGDIDVQPMVVRDTQRHESDDEEIEPALFEEDDPEGCAAEEVQEPGPERAFTMPLSIDQALLSTNRLETLDRTSTHVERVVSAPPVMPITTTSRTSAATANLMQGDGLDHFMQLRGKAPRLPKPVGEDRALLSALSAPKPNMAPAAVMVPQVENRQAQESESARISIPVPEVKRFATHHKVPIIVSSTFEAGNRQLLRILQTTLPSIDICDRDAVPAPLFGSSSSNSQTEEADLTISPSTGVILTTLQKLKQKPLPGQQPSLTSSLRARIVSTAPLYERLIILVKESSSSSSSNPSQPENASASAAPTSTVNSLDNLDCTALADLTAWTTTTFLSAPEVQILYIPGGDSEAANWLASAISHHHHQEILGAHMTTTTPANGNNNKNDDEFRFMPDETMWERWLRAAGLNAFAAQVVLRRLRLRDHPPSAKSETRFGLQALIAMSPEECAEVFGGLLGGERVLRVSEALDGGWRGVVVR